MLSVLQGTVKQLLPLPDQSDEVVSLEVCSHFLVVATRAGAVKVFDLSRRFSARFTLIGCHWLVEAVVKVPLNVKNTVSGVAIGYAGCAVHTGPALWGPKICQTLFFFK